MDYFKTQLFTDRVNELLSEWHSPGLTIALIQNDEIRSRGYGKASLDPDKSMTPDTLFDIASSSKSLTAASVALLVEDDKHPEVQWDTPMFTLLPDDFVMASEKFTQDITVEDILSHRTGLPSHDSSYLGIHAREPDTPRSITRNLRNLPLAAPIRSKYMYNNMLYAVASHLVESLSGQTFSTFLREHFFELLGMDSTHLQPSRAVEAGLADRMATPYIWREEEKRYVEVGWQECPEAQGAGSVVTSVEDYIKWVQTLMVQMPPVSAQLYRDLTKPRIVQSPDIDPEAKDPFCSPVLYAAGLEMFYYRGYEVIKHDGLVTGFGSCHFFLPAFRFGGVMLMNSSSGSRMMDVLFHELVDRLVGTPEEVRPDWNAVQREAEERSRREKKEQEAKYDVSRQCLNVPLSVYEGRYFNKGYRYMAVDGHAGKLLIDAKDRSFPFFLSLEHSKGGTEFLGVLRDVHEEDEERFDVKFRFDEHAKVVQMGLKLEPDLEEFIWVDKIDSSTSN